MCPACISAAAIVAYGSGAAAGAAALLFGARRAWQRVLAPRPSVPRAEAPPPAAEPKDPEAA